VDGGRVTVDRGRVKRRLAAVVAVYQREPVADEKAHHIRRTLGRRGPNGIVTVGVVAPTGAAFDKRLGDVKSFGTHQMKRRLPPTPGSIVLCVDIGTRVNQCVHDCGACREVQRCPLLAVGGIGLIPISRRRLIAPRAPVLAAR
jgi:hypothetical protein